MRTARSHNLCQHLASDHVPIISERLAQHNVTRIAVFLLRVVENDGDFIAVDKCKVFALLIRHRQGVVGEEHHKFRKRAVWNACMMVLYA